MDSGFYFISGTWTPNSGFLELYAGFQNPEFRIPESRIPSREEKIKCGDSDPGYCKGFFQFIMNPTH